MPSPPLPPESHSGLSAVLPWAAAAATSLVGFFAARFTAFAALNKIVLDASRLLVTDAQSIHARDSARISELEGEIVRQRGELANHIQREQSLQRQIDRLIGGEE